MAYLDPNAQQLAELMAQTGGIPAAPPISSESIDQMKAVVANNPSSKLLELRAKYKASKAGAPASLEQLRAKAKAATQPAPAPAVAVSAAPAPAPTAVPYWKKGTSTENQQTTKNTQQNTQTQDRSSTTTDQNAITVGGKQRVIIPEAGLFLGQALSPRGKYLEQEYTNAAGMPMYSVTPEGENFSLRDLPEFQAMADETANAEKVRDLYRATAVTGFGGADLSPLMAWVDARTGSNLAKYYRAPANEADAILGMDQSIYKQKSDAAKRLVDLAKGLTTADYSQTVADKTAQALRDAFGSKGTTGTEAGTSTKAGTTSEQGTKPVTPKGMGPKEQNDMYLKWRKHASGKDFLTLVKSYNDLTRMRGLMKSGGQNPAVINAVTKEIAKALEGGGKLTDKDFDIIRGELTPRYVDLFDYWRKRRFSGISTAKMTTQLAALVDVMSAALERKLNADIRSVAKTHTRFPGVFKTEEEAMQDVMNMNLGGGGVEDLRTEVPAMDPTGIATPEGIRTYNFNKGKLDEQRGAAKPSTEKPSVLQKWRNKVRGIQP